MRPRRTPVALLLLYSLSGGIGSHSARAGSPPLAMNETRYDSTRDPLVNPERGFCIQVDTRKKLQPIDSTYFERGQDAGVTLINRMFYLKDFRDGPLTPQALKTIEQDFAAARTHGFKLIPRFAYSSRIGEPDAPVKVVLGHIDQLTPLLRRNADVLMTLQAGFVGAWGEWHASTNELTDLNHTRAIAKALLTALPADRCIQVRTPKAKQQIVQARTPLAASEAFNGSAAARIGHHNDCFVASPTDVGTYRDNSLQPDREFVAHETRYLPMGGETCRDSDYASAERALAELKQMHWTYLNQSYHRGVLRRWEQASVLDQVRDRLGYRLALTTTRLPATIGSTGNLRGEITFTNTGWAAPINPRPLELVLKSDTGEAEHRFELPTDVRRWLPGAPVKVPIDLLLAGNIEPGAYQMLLALPDAAPGLRGDPRYAIRLANVDLWVPDSGAHRLPIRLEVTD